MGTTTKIVNISPEFMWIFLVLGILLFFIFSWILTFHWKSYGSDEKFYKVTKSIFWFGSIFLILVMLFLLTIYDFGL